MKTEKRKMIAGQRLSMDSERVMHSSRLISEKLFCLHEYKTAENMFIYLDFRNEVITSNIIVDALSRGKRVFVPACIIETKQLATIEITSLDHLERNFYGILEVKQEHIKLVDRSIIDTAIVPGVAFDRKGNRLGFGAGYYDRYFSSLAKPIKKIALAYSFQLVDSIPSELHDVPMDIIVTENEVISCKE